MPLCRRVLVVMLLVLTRPLLAGAQLAPPEDSVAAKLFAIGTTASDSVVRVTLGPIRQRRSVVGQIVDHRQDTLFLAAHSAPGSRRPIPVGDLTRFQVQRGTHHRTGAVLGAAVAALLSYRIIGVYTESTLGIATTASLGALAGIVPGAFVGSFFPKWDTIPPEQWR